MTALTMTIVIVFCVGYFLIAIEGITRINKAAIALLMMAFTWTLFMLDPTGYLSVADGQAAAAGASVIEGHLGSTSTTLFFLMGAMTIVELIDQNGGFNFVRTLMQTHSKRALLWRMAFMTFFISAILDNLTTSIVMIMVLRKLVPEQQDRIVYASLVVIAANSGGAFSPIGDVTTIMLWNKGVITAIGSRSGRHGAGEDHLRMVHKAHLMACLGRIPRGNVLLLGRRKPHLLISRT